MDRISISPTSDRRLERGQRGPKERSVSRCMDVRGNERVIQNGLNQRRNQLIHQRFNPRLAFLKNKDDDSFLAALLAWLRVDTVSDSPEWFLQDGFGGPAFLEFDECGVHARLDGADRNVEDGRNFGVLQLLIVRQDDDLP